MEKPTPKKDKDLGYPFLFALFAKYFSFTPEQVGSLTQTQVQLLQEGLNQLLEMESGESAAKDREEKLQEAQQKMIEAKIASLKRKGVTTVPFGDFFKGTKMGN